MTRSGLEPGRRGGKVATNRLGYGTAFERLRAGIIMIIKIIIIMIYSTFKFANNTKYSDAIRN
jgi:hypothetical protein